MARTNKSRFAILGMLSNKPMSGYDIKKNAENSISHFWQESYGQIYPVLKALSWEGLIQEVESESKEGRPQRRVYKILPSGTKALRKWLQLPLENPPVRSELLLKVFFARVLGAEVMAEQLRKVIPEVHARLEVYHGIEEELRHDPHPNKPYWMITLRQGIIGQESMLTWLEESIATLESL